MIRSAVVLIALAGALFCTTANAQNFRYFDPAQTFREHYPQLNYFDQLLTAGKNDQAVAYIQHLADAKHHGAQLVLGEMLLHGFQVDQDRATGLSLIEASLDGGHWFPHLRLAELMADASNIPLLAKEPEVYRNRLVVALRRWADAGCLFSQTEIGLIQLKNGHPKEAYRWLTLAADEGVSSAEYHLALLEMDGVAGRPNNDEALSLLELSATKGVIPAQQLLYQSYHGGKNNGLAFTYAAMVEQTWYRYKEVFLSADPEMDQMAARYRALAEALQPSLSSEDQMKAGMLLQRAEATAAKYEEWMGKKMREASLLAAQQLGIGQ